MEKKKVAVPLVCHGHSRPVVDLFYSPVTPDGFFLISASKGTFTFSALNSEQSLSFCLFMDLKLFWICFGACSSDFDSWMRIDVSVDDIRLLTVIFSSQKMEKKNKHFRVLLLLLWDAVKSCVYALSVLACCIVFFFVFFYVWV